MPLTENAPHSDVTNQIIGAGMAVHSKIGPGHKEAVYQAMLTDEMTARGLAVEPERAVEVVVDDKVYGLLCRCEGTRRYPFVRLGTSRGPSRLISDTISSSPRPANNC